MLALNKYFYDSKEAMSNTVSVQLLLSNNVLSLGHIQFTNAHLCRSFLELTLSPLVYPENRIGPSTLLTSCLSLCSTLVLQVDEPTHLETYNLLHLSFTHSPLIISQTVHENRQYVYPTHEPHNLINSHQNYINNLQTRFYKNEDQKGRKINLKIELLLNYCFIKVSSFVYLIAEQHAFLV